MESDLRLEQPEEGHKVEIDIRKILEQMGLDKDLWPQEWREAKNSNISPRPPSR